MGKPFMRNRHPAAAIARKQHPMLARGGTAPAGTARKSISFDANRNKVKFVRVPPRTKNPEYWFSERQKMVKKGLNFELEPEISVEINVESKLQIGAAAYCPSSSSSASSPLTSSSSARSKRVDRAFIEVKELQMSLIGLGADDEEEEEGDGGKWICIGSVGCGETAKMKVLLPSGMYQLRCVGCVHPVHMFAEAWDVERELF